MAHNSATKNIFRVSVDADAACVPFLHDIKPLTEEQQAALHKKVDATPESLKRDVKILREWLAQQPHLPQLQGMYPRTVHVGGRVRLCVRPCV